MSDAYEKLKFFKKKCNFNLFSNYQIKIVFLFKKVMLIKKKLSNLLKLLVEEQKRVNRQKKMNIEKQKINLTSLMGSESGGNPIKNANRSRRTTKDSNTNTGADYGDFSNPTQLGTSLLHLVKTTPHQGHTHAVASTALGTDGGTK